MGYTLSQTRPKRVQVLKAIEFYENRCYDYEVVFKNKFIEVYNRYGKLVLKAKISVYSN